MIKKRILFFVLSFFFFSPVFFAETSAEEVKPATHPKKSTASSRTLIQQAWSAYVAKDYDLAMKNADACVATFEMQARQQQDSLKEPMPLKEINHYWQLNDVATAKFIKGKIYIDKNQLDKAKESLNDVINNYFYAMSYDPKGWHWNVADAARKLSDDLRVGSAAADGASGFLKNKALEAQKKEDYAAVSLYAEKCIGLYQESALVQQKQLSKYPEEKKIQRYWALNDVGTCRYLAGIAAAKTGDLPKAREHFKFVKEKLSYASFWDSHGWYLKLTNLVAEKEKELQL